MTKKELRFTFLSHTVLCFNSFSFLFSLLMPAAILSLWLLCLHFHLRHILVFQTQQSNNLPNGTLFQVKVAYAYTPVHDDELSINPNDIVNVTRMVCQVLCSCPVIKHLMFRSKKVGMKEYWMANLVYFHQITSHGLLKKIVSRKERIFVWFENELIGIGSKKDPPVKRKPVNGVGVMFNKDVCIWLIAFDQ